MCSCFALFRLVGLICCVRVFVLFFFVSVSTNVFGCFMCAVLFFLCWFHFRFWAMCQWENRPLIFCSPPKRFIPTLITTWADFRVQIHFTRRISVDFLVADFCKCSKCLIHYDRLAIISFDDWKKWFVNFVFHFLVFIFFASHRFDFTCSFFA